MFRFESALSAAAGFILSRYVNLLTMELLVGATIVVAMGCNVYLYGWYLKVLLLLVTNFSDGKPKKYPPPSKAMQEPEVLPPPISNVQIHPDKTQ